MKATIIDRRPSTQDISWFLDLYRVGQLDLNPSYQRRSVWSLKDRRYFLDTIFRGYPSPAIYLHKETRSGGKTIYAVVDGKQRLETIIQFAENKISVDAEFGDSRLDGKKWKKISEELDLARNFWDYVMPVEFISVGDSGTLLNEVFDRLNRNSRKLVEQELRHARYNGWFIDFVENESKSQDWVDLGIVTTARARRMRDVQFLSELLIILLKNDVGGFDQNEIDEFCANYEEPCETIPMFDEEELKHRWTSAKRYLLELEKNNNAISTYSKDFINFYTLWSLVVTTITNLPTSSIFSIKYAEFMCDVAKFKDKTYLEKVMNKEEAPQFSQSLKYFQNSIGASTEFPQRKERLAAIFSVIYG
ncbi:MAG: DUF262 domain-containing protein [Desulfomicrobium sp.]|nr:DUF262 domain-containing protein [Pseudomonadota bacterium]MBV1710913.1 DUF262 domain-containing protein [Desulfomicrobium sp.]MBU4570567.1 DUF262 domain-containing protein [Pseudomonadota bacterium]MBU4593331.1 DUF262 domain-containing protein [Pseudomonadota bacterium]MBV1719355.1 DUF262 domain-containing protein [Desulfomicrobium sp.]